MGHSVFTKFRNQELKYNEYKIQLVEKTIVLFTLRELFALSCGRKNKSKSVTVSPTVRQLMCICWRLTIVNDLNISSSCKLQCIHTLFQ